MDGIDGQYDSLTCLIWEILHILDQPFPKRSSFSNNHSYIKVLDGTSYDFRSAGSLLIHQDRKSSFGIKNWFSYTLVECFRESASFSTNNIRSMRNKKSRNIHGRRQKTSRVAAEVKNKTLDFKRAVSTVRIQLDET